MCAFRFSAFEALYTQADIKRRLSYNPETGVFTRHDKKAPGRVRNGRNTIRLDGHEFFAQRVAWLYMTGSWPSDTVDHIDRNKGNDAWNNLRMATHSEPHMNKRTPKASGLPPGVYKRKDRTNLWSAKIKLHNKTTHLGYFKSESAAHQAYLSAKQKMHVISSYEKENSHLCTKSA